MAVVAETEEKTYLPLPTLLNFHRSNAQNRAIVGPVGSGKTSGGAWELCYYLPFHIFKTFGILKTRWAVVRNTYRELSDTTQKTILDWFPWGEHKKIDESFHLVYPTERLEVELLFRSCDRAEDIKKFKSLEITGYWIDESIEVNERVKLRLSDRAGRFPSAQDAIRIYKKHFGYFPEEWLDENGNEMIPLPKYGIETTNPPDVEHPLYSKYKWFGLPEEAPMPQGEPIPGYIGFWQPPDENVINLRQNYYHDLANDYRDNPDWIDIYIKGLPGIIAKGKLVYNNFRKSIHVANQKLIWANGPLYRGWDNTGHSPACVVVQVPSANRVQVLKEFTGEKMNIVSFTNYVVNVCNMEYPNAKWQDWGDPAGEQRFSTKDGGWTSNAQMMRDECNVNVIASEQNFEARINAVEKQLSMIDGLLLDPSVIRLINGFLGGYHYKEIGTTGEYSDIVEKNRFSHVHDALHYVLTKLVKSSSASSLQGFRPQRHRFPMMVKR